MFVQLIVVVSLLIYYDIFFIVSHNACQLIEIALGPVIAFGRFKCDFEKLKINFLKIDKFFKKLFLAKSSCFFNRF